MMETVDSENRILSALGYPIWIVALIVLFTKMKSNRFMRLHAVQALGFNIAFWMVIINVSIVNGIVHLWQLAFLERLAQLAWLVAALIYAYRAYQGQSFDIPVVSQFATKYAGAEFGIGPGSRNFARINVKVWWVLFCFSVLSGPLFLLYMAVISVFTKDTQLVNEVVSSLMYFHVFVYAITTLSLRKWIHALGMVLLFPIAYLLWFGSLVLWTCLHGECF